MYEDPKIVEMEMGLLSFDEKLVLAPLPVFPYSWNVTYAVLGELELQTSRPAEAIIEISAVFWKQTLAYSLHGRPR